MGLMSLNIGHVTPTFLPTRGGAEHAVSRLAAFSSRLGHSVSVFTNRLAKSIPPQPYGICSYRPLTYWTLLHAPALGSRWLRSQLLAWHHRHPCDIWHIHFANHFGRVAMAAASALGVPCILSCHSQSDLPLPAPLPSSLWAIAAGNPDLLACQTVLPPLGAHAIPWGIDSARFAALHRSSSYRASVGCPPDAHLWVAVARNVPGKNLRILLAAAHILHCRTAGTHHLLLIGTGVCGLRSVVAELGISSAVTLVEPDLSQEDPTSVPPQAVRMALAHADAYLSASGSESFGIALLEALAAGLPALVSDTAGHRAILSRYAGARLLADLSPSSVAQAMARFCEGGHDKTHAERLAVHVRDQSDWSIVATRFQDLYRRVLAAAGSGGETS